MTTTRQYSNRQGNTITVGAVVDVLSFGAEGVEGGTVVALRRTRGANPVAMATIRQASGAEVSARVAYLIPR
jgi:hypothetical protein